MAILVEDVYYREEDTTHDWDQEWIVLQSQATPPNFKPTPQSGQLTIAKLLTDGSRLFWDGVAFSSAIEVVLDTTINSKVSHYPFSIPGGSTDSYEFIGWLNEDRATAHIVRLMPGPTPRKGEFDIEEGGSFLPQP